MGLTGDNWLGLGVSLGATENGNSKTEKQTLAQHQNVCNNSKTERTEWCRRFGSRAATTLATIPSFCVAQEVAFSVNDHNPGGNCFPQIVFSKTNQKYINVQASASARL